MNLFPPIFAEFLKEIFRGSRDGGRGWRKREGGEEVKQELRKKRRFSSQVTPKYHGLIYYKRFKIIPL